MPSTDAQARVVAFSTPTATGNQTYACALNHKACLIVLTGHDPADVGVETANAIIGVGATDGTRNRYTAATSQNNVNPTNDYATSGNNHLIYLIGTGGAAFVVGDFVSLDDSGLTINWTTVDATARDGFIVFFYGGGVQAYVNDTGDLGVAAGTTVITGLGFVPRNAIFFGGDIAAASFNSTLNKFAFSIGMARTFSPLQQAPFSPVSEGGQVFASMSEPDAQGTGGGAAGRPGCINSLEAVLGCWTATLDRNYVGYISDWGGDGFSVSTNANANNASYCYLALTLAPDPDSLDGSFGDGAVNNDQIGNFQVPYTDFPFPPVTVPQEQVVSDQWESIQFVLAINTGYWFSSNSGSSATAVMGGIGISAFDILGTAAAAAVRIQGRDANVSVTGSIVTGEAIRCTYGLSSAAFSAADFVAINDTSPGIGHRSQAVVNWTKIDNSQFGGLTQNFMTWAMFTVPLYDVEVATLSDNTPDNIETFPTVAETLDAVDVFSSNPTFTVALEDQLIVRDFYAVIEIGGEQHWMTIGGDGRTSIFPI